MVDREREGVRAREREKDFCRVIVVLVPSFIVLSIPDHRDDVLIPIVYAVLLRDTMRNFGTKIEVERRGVPSVFSE